MIPHTFLLLFRVKIVRSPNDLFKKNHKDTESVASNTTSDSEMEPDTCFYHGLKL